MYSNTMCIIERVEMWTWKLSEGPPKSQYEGKQDEG
ncbi:hypothetical protein HS7_12870 [Sulfolobales archaeon HS-7]|nr:hypothetical protein HS7_12870 [Sulfolobales archaeon HS-7]